MKTLREYIESILQKHDIRIKIACDVTDEMMDKIEHHLEKYDAERISRPNKTILMKRPLDFPNMDMAEVYIIDFTANLPVSTEMLHIELAKLLDLPEGSVVVRNANEPREIEAQRDEEQEKFLKNPKKLEAKIGTDYTKDEAAEEKASDLYGDKYNSAFLKELKKLSDARKKETKQPKLKDPDVPLSEPIIGDPKDAVKTSPLTKTAKLGKQPTFARD
jgi:hypothetical protein